jgi:hypothetical protein
MLHIEIPISPKACCTTVSLLANTWPVLDGPGRADCPLGAGDPKVILACACIEYSTTVSSIAMLQRGFLALLLDALHVSYCIPFVPDGHQ